jgi:hypothetical protein
LAVKVQVNVAYQINLGTAILVMPEVTGRSPMVIVPGSGLVFGLLH